MSEIDTNVIMAIGAHPDDIEFGCGGILLQEGFREVRIELVVCSRGESGTNGTPEVRTKEAEAAAALMGAGIRFQEMEGDGLIQASKENALALARIIRERRPRLLLAPTWIENQHPDHVAVAKLAREAARLARYGGLGALEAVPAWTVDAVLHYAISPSGEPHLPPHYLVDISNARDRWEKLMQCHASQMKTRNYLDLQVARARVWGLQAGIEYAQGLWSEDPMLAENLSAIGRAARSL